MGKQEFRVKLMADNKIKTTENIIAQSIKNPKDLTHYLHYRKKLKEEGLSDFVNIFPLGAAINWARANSIWPLTFGISCCAVEMMTACSSKFDIERFGTSTFCPTPRQADLIIVAGTVTYKLAPRIKKLYEQIPNPKHVIVMGSCAIGGGPYAKLGYQVVKGVDRIIPVDIFIPGCPPRPEALIDAILTLQDKISTLPPQSKAI